MRFTIAAALSLVSTIASSASILDKCLLPDGESPDQFLEYANDLRFGASMNP